MEQNKLSLQDLLSPICEPIDLTTHGIDSIAKLFQFGKGPPGMDLEELHKIEEIRRKVAEKITTKRVRGGQMLRDFKSTARKFETGIGSFDEIFKAEMEPTGSYLNWGDVVELVGESDTGKTHLIQHILTVDDTCYDIAYYIDTRIKFSATKLNNMMQDFKYSEKQIETILRKINVMRADDLDKLYECLNHINESQDSKSRKVIVIDSITPLILLYMGDPLVINSLLVDVMHVINKLKKNSTFLITNLASFVEKETGFADECKPFCGSFWSSFSDHKILVTKENGCELLKSKHFAIEEKEDEEASQDDNEQ